MRIDNPLLLTDFYKVGHPFQYPEDTTKVYSNYTARKSRVQGVDKIVFFGLQYFIKEYLIRIFNEQFFSRPIDKVLDPYKRRVRNALGKDLPTYDHIVHLHSLGYLPIKIKALPEGVTVPMRVPCITLENTDPKCYWLTNWIESIMSAIIWQPITSATTSHEYRKILDRYGAETGIPPEFTQWQAHDFSFRGMSSLESAITSGMGHLLSFTGTDTIPAIDALEQYYNANSDTELIGGSIPATEHSVMMAGGKEDELDTFARLIKMYGDGPFSVVSDTWDLWHVLTVILPALKPKIMAMKGKIVIRPDSGDPVDIICGLKEGHQNVGVFKKGNAYYETHYFGNHGRDEETLEVQPLPEHKGVIECLWDVFGGTINEKGYKVLDPHVGAIYGDSITPARAEEMGARLKAKGFAMQVVLGVGSFTFQMVTRDTYGMAMKATYVEIDGVGHDIFKDPVTDDGTKKSATGLLQVYKEDRIYKLIDKCTKEEEDQGKLEVVFENGQLIKDYTLAEIREILKNQ